MRHLMLLAAIVATSAGCSTNNRMLDPVHTPPITVAPAQREGDSTHREDPYEDPTSRRVDGLWP